MISNKRVFLLSAWFGLIFVLAAAAHDYSPPPPRVAAHYLYDNVWVTNQIGPDSIARYKAQGFSTVIDLRPDGEAADQPSSSAMAAAARANGVRFAYVPVPHGAIPEATPKALGQELTDTSTPVLLYCRSGSRAARTWALMEASRPDGANAETILQSVRRVGQSADDLAVELNRRVAMRALKIGANQ